MKKSLLISLLGTSILLLPAKEKEGIIMTVDGFDIPSSEFEYLYMKNSSQLLEPQTFDDYVELFKIYRLKVAEAKATGVDTVASFRQEIGQYKRELLQPFITDSAFIYNLIDIAAARDKEEVEASHIMIRKQADPTANAHSIEILDSLRQLLINGASFSELAKKYSEDPSVTRNEGYLGYIGAGKFPYAFETAVFTTPEGEISEVIDSSIGYHLVKPGQRRPSRGKVDVAHIIKLVPAGMSPEDELKQKNLIDSIYKEAIANPDSFAELAMKFSDERGAAKSGGKLPLFGAGEMVPEFEIVAFNTADNEISMPFKTSFGWHILKKYGSKPSKQYDEVKAEVLKKIENPQDARFAEINNHNLEIIAAKHPEVENSGNKKAYYEALMSAEEASQYKDNQQYRLLVDEYTDGSMLYEVSLENVWDKAIKDQKGLEAFFKKNKKHYKFESPTAKGVLIQVKNDSIAETIKSVHPGMTDDEIVSYVKSNFPTEAIAEKFIAVEGTNSMIDNVMFNGPAASPKAKGFGSFFILNGRMLQLPEEVNDVKLMVTTDYQDSLEKEWIKKLKKKYKVNLNKKELSKIKARYQQ